MGFFKWLFGRKNKEEENYSVCSERKEPGKAKKISSVTASRAPIQSMRKGHNMSQNKYEVKAVYKPTNRARKLIVFAKNEADVKTQLTDYKEPDSIKEIPYDLPSERQMAFAAKLGISVPAACCKEDMTALISEALRKEDLEFSGKPWRRVSPGNGLLRFADSKHIPYSNYAEEFQVIRDCYMLYLKDKKESVAFLIACMYKHLRGNWNFLEWDKWLKDAEVLLADESFVRSLGNSMRLDDGFQGFDYHETISSRTKLYQMLANRI